MTMPRPRGLLFCSHGWDRLRFSRDGSRSGDACPRRCLRRGGGVKRGGDGRGRPPELKTRPRGYLPDSTRAYTSRWNGDGPTLDHLDQLCEDLVRDLEKVLLEELGLL